MLYIVEKKPRLKYFLKELSTNILIFIFLSLALFVVQDFYQAYQNSAAMDKEFEKMRTMLDPKPTWQSSPKKSNLSVTTDETI